MANLPDGLSLERHRDLSGRVGYVWVRRALLSCIAVLPILALLNVFGQHPVTTYAANKAVSMSVTAPARLRSGLIFQVKINVTARRDINTLRLGLDEGWWESMSVNSILPEPEEETFKDGHIQLAYAKLMSGESFVIRIYVQVNPTNVGERREDVTVADGNTSLLTLHRSLTIFP